MTNWLHTDKEFRAILHRNNSSDEKSCVANSKKEIIAHLKSNPLYKELSPEIIKALQCSTTFYTFNQALISVYNYADFHKIRIDF